MPNEIQTKLDSVGTFAITLAALASGNARQSSIVTNSLNRFAALIFLKIETGAVAPTTGTVVEIFLLRNDRIINYSTDGCGNADAAITINNAQMIGTIVVNASANTFFWGDFDTAPLGPLSGQWGIAVRNSTDQALHGTEGNFVKEWNYYVPEIQ
jgi:hypothetical protein